MSLMDLNALKSVSSIQASLDVNFLTEIFIFINVLLTNNIKRVGVKYAPMGEITIISSFIHSVINKRL